MTDLFQNGLVVAEHIGWTLLHSLWQLTLLAIPFALVLTSLRSARARYRVAYVGLLLMAIVPIVYCFLSYSPGSSQPTDSPGSADMAAIDANPTERETLKLETTESPSRDEGKAIDESSGVADSMVTESQQYSSGAVWLAAFWLCGVAILSIRQIGGWWLALRIVRNAVDVESQVTRDCLARLAESMKINRCIKLLQSAEIHTPMVIGYLRPCLIVPVSLLSGLTADQLTTLFAHELAHLRRNDFLQNLLQTAIETILFYHPVVWWISKTIRTEREHLCDDASVEVVGKPIRLAEALTAIQTLGLQTAGPVPSVAQTASKDTGSALLNRVRRLVAKAAAPNTVACHRPSIMTRVFVAVGMIATFGVLVPLVIAVQNDSANENTASSPVAENGPPEPWEISKIYDASFLRTYLRDNEVLPKPIVVPAVRGQVVDLNGKPVSGATLISHTPRQWVNLQKLMGDKPRTGHDAVLTTKADGRFGLPERKEPYRVLVVHDDGVTSISHEQLIRANGKVVLQKWATVTGTLVLGGKPQANETVALYFNTVPWSYSRLGPRLSTNSSYRTKTDAMGRFSFDQVVPLSGRAHHVSSGKGGLGRGTLYECQSGRETRIEIGVGATATGQLVFTSDIEKEKVQVRVKPQTIPIPYPKEIAEGSPEERKKWRREWSGTKAGYAITDRNFDLGNSNVPGTVNADGTFEVYGIKQGKMTLQVRIPNEGLLLKKEFRCVGGENESIDLGDLYVGERADEQKATKAALLPNMIVKTVDVDGNPVVGTNVMFYDREGYSQNMAFEIQNRTTNELGIADFGRMPHDFGHIEISPIGKLAGCYNVMSSTGESSPQRANTRVTLDNGELEITVTMTPGVDLKFKITDEKTGEIVYWPEIFYQDSETKRWWMIAIVDGSKRQHNFIPISPKMTQETIKIFAVGYETETIQFPADMDLSKQLRPEVKLKQLPDVEFTVLRADGKPAKFAKIEFNYPNGPSTLQDNSSKTDAKGECRMQFPTAAELGTLQITHATGKLSAPLKPLLVEARTTTSATIQHVVQLKVD